MSKIKIKIVQLGHNPHSLDFDKILKWKSDLFEIIGSIGSINIVGASDGKEWTFLDVNIEGQLPTKDGEDILLAVTNVPIQNNYFFRRFKDNKACMTFHTMADILKYDNIPLENLLLRVLYSVSLVYRRFGDRVPLMTDLENYTHDDTRGCIFDFNGVKSDVIYSLDKPQLCHSCVETLVSNPAHKIDKNLVAKVQQELKGIKKDLYFRLTDFVKMRPILSIIISSLIAILLGVIGSTIATVIWESLKSTKA